VFAGTPMTAGSTVDFWRYDGDEHPPESVTSLVGERMPKTGSVWIGTEGTLVLPHMDPPWFLLPTEKFAALQAPELPPREHYAEFLDAVLAKQRTQPSAGFQYSGPLAEAVVLGTVAMHFPEQTLTWRARSMKFKDHDDANDLLRRKPRKGWKQRGL
jgi:hypothetical protein